MTVPAIRATGLTKVFGSGAAVDSLSLELPKGSVFGFLGPNGAGKTTTIRLLLGILEPTSGRAEVLGHDVASAGQDVRRRTGVVLDHTGLYAALSAQENLRFFADIFGMTGDAALRRQRELLERFGLWKRRDDPVGGFSRGMKQKVALSRALLHGPELLFLDEPTAGLDPVAAAEFRGQIASLARDEGTTVFLTTHDMSEAEEICDLVGVIRSGRLLAVGDPQAIGADPRATATVRISGEQFSADLVEALSRLPEVLTVAVQGRDLVVEVGNATDTPAVVAAVVRTGGRIRGVEERRVSLRAAFLELMEDSA